MEHQLTEKDSLVDSLRHELAELKTLEHLFFVDDARVREEERARWKGEKQDLVRRIEALQVQLYSSSSPSSKASPKRRSEEVRSPGGFLLLSTLRNSRKEASNASRNANQNAGEIQTETRDITKL